MPLNELDRKRARLETAVENARLLERDADTKRDRFPKGSDEWWIVLRGECDRATAARIKAERALSDFNARAAALAKVIPVERLEAAMADGGRRADPLPNVWVFCFVHSRPGSPTPSRVTRFQAGYMATCRECIAAGAELSKRLGVEMVEQILQAKPEGGSSGQADAGGAREDGGARERAEGAGGDDDRSGA